MSSFSDKIVHYFANRGIKSRVHETVVAMTSSSGGQRHRVIHGDVTAEKLDAIIDEYKRDISDNVVTADNG